MTTYVGATEVWPDGYRLWSDTEDEAFCFAAAVGGVPTPEASPLHYRVTGAQSIDAVHLGAELVETPYEALEAAARFHGNNGALASIAEWRLTERSTIA